MAPVQRAPVSGLRLCHQQSAGRALPGPQAHPAPDQASGHRRKLDAHVTRGHRHRPPTGRPHRQSGMAHRLLQRLRAERHHKHNRRPPQRPRTPNSQNRPPQTHRVAGSGADGGEERGEGGGGDCEERVRMYLKIKKVMDSFLAAVGLIILSPLFCVLIIWIKLDSKGPVLFKQKRIGIHKKPFHILKFRTMRIDTPKDMPTHMLADPEQYITKAGHFLRKTSLDELPQIINILVGDMSIIGPRPALWNQYDLIAERDKYGANDVLPGLTGWAQINGRDELEIPVKAKLDGEYVAKLRKGSLSGFLMDIRCFFGTIVSVLRSDGVVEGGTGEMKKQREKKAGKQS